ncbi:phage major capsid protein [Bacillus cereus group sp. Bc015]|uniref:major capsid protein n=1 Tax=Bacillus cereus group sp. Bc015 TaxID=3018123 RepID=UPI0022E539A3|nr:phage major capsid protein [Bacillus cereus group sp. Bc015]MDA2738383.1 phage major capsid protein [Bacillus cereus group sp. Bc015]
MALMLVDAQVLSKDVLQAGVIETIVRESSVLSVLPFQEIEGNAYSYNVEKALPTVAFRGVNEAYTSSEAQFEQRSENLVILGGDVELDRFIIQTLSNVNDQMAVQIMEKAKAVANTFSKTFFKGNKATNPKEFDGLDVRIAGTGQEIDGTLPAGTTDKAEQDRAMLDQLNQLLDAVRGGADAIFLNKRSRRRVLAILQNSNHYVEQGTDAFGKPVSMYGGVPLLTVENEILADTDLYAVKFGTYTHVAGLTNGGVQVRQLGETSAKAVEVTRIEFFCGLAQFNPYSSARLKNFGVVATA